MLLYGFDAKSNFRSTGPENSTAPAGCCPTLRSTPILALFCYHSATCEPGLRAYGDRSALVTH